jgi:drug/metabolite transporter (DMT)-like permease
MAVVAPLSASYPALTVALSVINGEHLTLFRFAGIVAVVIGAAVVAGGEKSQGSFPAAGDASPSSPLTQRSGMAWALCSAIGFGFLFWLLGTRIVPAVGYGATVWMIRLTSSILTALVILCLKQPIALRRPGPIPLWLISMGALDTGAFVMNNYGMRIEQIAVVSVLASLYGAVTVGLAAIFLRERVSRPQWLGIVTIFAGIVFISR